MQTAWKTGRFYTEHGQRIAALYRDGRVYFYDIDRNIDGHFPVNHQPADFWALQHITTAAYDAEMVTYSCPHDIRQELAVLAKSL